MQHGSWAGGRTAGQRCVWGLGRNRMACQCMWCMQHSRERCHPPHPPPVIPPLDTPAALCRRSPSTCRLAACGKRPATSARRSGSVSSPHDDCTATPSAARCSLSCRQARRAARQESAASFEQKPSPTTHPHLPHTLSRSSFPPPHTHLSMDVEGLAHRPRVDKVRAAPVRAVGSGDVAVAAVQRQQGRVVALGAAEALLRLGRLLALVPGAPVCAGGAGRGGGGGGGVWPSDLAQHRCTWPTLPPTPLSHHHHRHPHTSTPGLVEHSVSGHHGHHRQRLGRAPHRPAGQQHLAVHRLHRQAGQVRAWWYRHRTGAGQGRGRSRGRGRAGEASNPKHAFSRCWHHNPGAPMMPPTPPAPPPRSGAPTHRWVW